MLRTIEQKKGEAGSGLVEFAVVAVVLLTVLFGIMDVGRALYAYNYVSDAARRGARYAMVRGSTWTTECSPSLPAGCYATSSDIQTYVVSNATGINTSDLSVTGACIVPSGGGAGPPCDKGDPVQVQVQYNFDFITPLLPQVGWKMTSTSQMVVSR